MFVQIQKYIQGVGNRGCGKREKDKIVSILFYFIDDYQ